MMIIGEHILDDGLDVHRMYPNMPLWPLCGSALITGHESNTHKIPHNVTQRYALCVCDMITQESSLMVQMVDL